MVSFGPTGFPACARLRFLPDPAYEGQSENDVDSDIPYAGDQWPALVELLASHTRTPGDCYFGLWDGWGFDSLRDQPKFSLYHDFPDARRFPVRSYFLFRGPLSEVGDWDGDGLTLPYEPAFVWPADRAWCVAYDVDPHWAGIGADTSVVARIVADPRLDAVAADPAQDQPEYR
jgi:hypothetical protein